ncbi:protein kinase [Streptomyces sp. 21So2-11]|uniref:serine/threonine-protein kinase n=1 Tax=Streptomyces sp. 21So2-11 TaxID=3144408 RepID=UPI00321A407A
MFSPLTHDDPQQLGTYRLIARLGSGGMGTVYLARSSSGRTAALKTMHARIATDPAFRTRFRLEVDAARVIGGVHGAQVFDAAPLSEMPWLATEYILGPPLDDAVALAGPLPEPAVRALGAALCHALAQLHASEVVHRDLKPSNIMITADGPKVIDFGIARAIGDARLTRVGAADGTPAFMSPEQATGQEHTSAGDIFALAGVLVHAATGHGPFGSGQPADLLYRVRYADPDLTGVSDSLATVLARCLSKAPADRPTTVELAAQLSTSTSDFACHLPEALLIEITRRAAEVWHIQPHRLLPPADTLPEPSTVPPPPAMSRRKLLTVGGGSTLGVAAVGTGAWAWLGGRNTRNSGTGAPNGGATTSASATPKGEWLWRLPISTSKSTIVPPVPLTYVGWIVIADDNGVRFIDGERGGVEFPSLSKALSHQCVTDGDQVHTCELPPDADGPLSIKSFDLIRGVLDPPLVTFQDFNGRLLGTQLLCAADGVLYLAAGQGKESGKGVGFRSDQSWFLLAVNTRTRKIIWRRPLPQRSATSQRLHFLASQVMEKHLVLLQETSGGKVRLSVRDTRTGNVRWEQSMAVSEPDDVQGQLAVDLFYVYPPVGALRALRLSDGKEEWNFGDGRSRRTGPPTATTHAVYAVEEGLGVVAVDPMTGELQWEEKGGRGAEADFDAPPVAIDGFENVYSKGPGQLRTMDGGTGRTGRAYEATEDRFFAHDSAIGDARRIIAMGDEFITGYALQ